MGLPSSSIQHRDSRVLDTLGSTPGYKRRDVPTLTKRRFFAAYERLREREAHAVSELNVRVERANAARSRCPVERSSRHHVRGHDRISSSKLSRGGHHAVRD